MLAVNFGDEELRINKGITICLTCVADITKIYHNKKPADSINEINDINVKMNESVTNKSVSNETLTPIPPNSSFLFHKPRIMLLDMELSNKYKQQLTDLLE